MEKISVALAGPWWTHLTYLAPQKYAVGTRVRVPVGNGSRVGLVMPPDGEWDYAGELREISAVIDERPILPGFIIPLIQWFKDTYLCGTGTAMKTLLPANFLRGDGFVSISEADGGRACEQTQERGGRELFRCSKPAAPMDSFIYEPIDSARWKRYEEMLSDGLPSLICFPQYDAARAFAKKFEGLTLFPKSGAGAEWRAWSKLLTSPGDKIVLGGQTASVAPLPGIARIIVEDESSNAWLTVRPPVFNVRSLLAKRARIEGTSLVLGGRMPSSRAYIAMERRKEFEPPSSAVRARQNNFIFVDMKLAYSPSVKGLHDSLAVSEPLVRESEAAFSRGSWALWILDRRGYAGEIICEECGSPLRCQKCRGAMRWEASADRLACVACGFYDSIPENCPNCGGRLLMARRPGLEALLPLAKSAINGAVPVLSAEGGSIPSDALSSASGLLIGTRAALAMCDKIAVGMVGWIDADGEARGREFDARCRAFGLIWESRWRGKSPENRVVLLQTRRPGKDWQRGLAYDRQGSPGWRVFWRDEMKERREFSMPPFTSLVKIDTSRPEVMEMTRRFDAKSLEHWVLDSEEPAGSPPKNSVTVWLRTNTLAPLRNALIPFFSIKKPRRPSPSITIRHE